MQDRVNYRFWDKEEKVMFDWDCIRQTAFNCYIREEGNKMQRYGLMYWAFTTPSKFIPLQCTGLKDKNDKLIFEGDLLKDGRGQVGKVFYNTASASYEINRKMKDGSYETDGCFVYGEVIGNVYQNPELLEVNNENT